MTAVTIGKFESIHKGHQYLIAETVKHAVKNNLSSVVVTFDPHPRRVLNDPGYCPLFTYKEREYILLKQNIDKINVFSFSKEFALQTAEQFCCALFDTLQAKCIVLGENYRFGYNRMGTAEMLKEFAARRGAEVLLIQHIYKEDKKISTSDIRDYLVKGCLPEVKSLLGFSFFVMGNVVHGKQLGAAIGFPTANIIPPEDKLLPPDGVYATYVHIEQGLKRYKGVTNIGLRPSVNDGLHRTIETFILDFNENLYDKTLNIEFISFLRPEQKFKCIGALQTQIAKDAEMARLC